MLISRGTGLPGGARGLCGLLAAVALLAFALSACGAPERADSPASADAAERLSAAEGPEDAGIPEGGGYAGTVFPYTFTDGAGRTVTLAARPRRVAVLFSSFADIWVTAGGTVDVTVGESVERGFAHGGAVLVDPGAGHTSIDTEALIAAAPDLVIGTADYDCQVQAVQLCAEAGIPAALFRVECFADYMDVLGLFCDINGESERYETYGIAVQDRITGVLKKVSDLESESQMSFLFVRAGSSARSTKAKTAEDNFVCAMLSELGADNIADRDNGLTGELSLEVILQEDPDILFISTMGDEAAAREYMDSQLRSDGWRELACVARDRCYYLPKELFHYKPNAHWDEAYEYLAKILYPELAA